MTKPNPFDDCILVPSGAITMMNSSADDFDFPPNPFRSTPTGTSNGMQQQSQQQQGFFHSPPVDAAFAPATQQQQQQQQQQQDPLGNHGSFQPQLVQQQHTTVPTNATYGRTATTMLMQPSGMMDNNNQNATSLAPAVGAAPTSRLQACFACFRIDTYRSYFDMDTIDIQNRVKNSLLMCFMPDKFRVQVVGVERNDTTKGPDLYGPLWITMTLIFFLALTSNMSNYFRVNPSEVEYDISHLASAMTVCFSFSFGVPILFWVLTQCMAMQAMLMVEWICLYGYSLVGFLPATLLCLIPFELWVWFCLTAATVTSGLLIVRNVAAPLLSSDAVGNKAGPILMAIMGSHVIFLIVVKLVFYR